jgi:hypothetical protein
MEKVGIFYVHSVHYTAFGNILWPFVIFMAIWYIFTRFGMLYHEKAGNPERHTDKRVFTLIF